MVVVISGFSSQQTRQNFKCGILLSAVLQNQVTDLHSSICSQGLEECWALMQRWYQTQSNFSVFLLKQRGLMGQWNIIILISCAEGYSRCNWQHISPKKNISRNSLFTQDENRLLPCLTKTKTRIVHSWPLRKMLNN